MKIAILGCAGSIGTQTLECIDNLSGYEVSALVTYSNSAVLKEQCKKYHPQYSALIRESGVDCLKRAIDTADIAVIATSGITALEPILYAIKKGVKVALANKESLVVGGVLINETLAAYGGSLYPIDSEHSALWQCLKCGKKEEVKNIYLTASGGAFRDYTIMQLQNAKAKEALEHPTWKMGKKITVDSATMMNKGLEIIEAYYLFGQYAKVIINRESIIHSYVEYVDGAIIAQMGNPDMKMAIQYALTYPKRMETNVKPLDLAKIGILHFEDADRQRFPCLAIAEDVLKYDKSKAVVMSAANDVCVNAYIEGKIGFYDISDIIKQTINDITIHSISSVEEIIMADKVTRNYVYGKIYK
ncbi:MAG: 1-deoxy-D-xylulose-5-phosphate reductoisomerase [Clostridia bacterium]